MSANNNKVELSGKVTRNEGLRYTPSGVPICDFKIAVTQEYFKKKTVGYFEAQLVGELAEEIGPNLKIGKRFSLEGELWMRSYRHRNGSPMSETKILVKSIQLEEPAAKPMRRPKVDSSCEKETR